MMASVLILHFKDFKNPKKLYMKVGKLKVMYLCKTIEVFYDSYLHIKLKIEVVILSYLKFREKCLTDTVF